MERNWPRIAMWVVGLLIVGWLLSRLSTLVGITIVVGLITFPIYPLVDRLESRAHVSRGMAAAIALLATVGILILGLLIVIPWIISQGQLLVAIAPQGAKAIADFLSTWQARVAEPTFPQVLRTAWGRAGESAVATANAAVSRIVNVLVEGLGQIYLVLLVPFVMYFVLLDYGRMRASLLSFVPKPTRTRIDTLLSTLNVTLRRALWAQVVVSSIVGVLTMAGLAVLRVPGPLAIGLFAGIAEAIPYVGGFATYAVVLLAAVPLGGTTWLWGMFVVTIVKTLSNLLVPLVMGRMTQTPPLAIIAALLILGQLFGLLGMFFAVPAVVVVREILALWRPARTTA